jgi:N-acetylmuramoyl-L-alanine amidase
VEHQEPLTTETEARTPTERKRAVEPVSVEIEGKPEKAPRYNITEEELDIVARVVHSEARGEGFVGQALVAQCILNTAEATGKRPDEVVLEPGQYAAPAAEASEEVKAAVRAVFIDGYQVTPEPIRWFYAYKRCNSAWHESKRHVLTYKNHKFFA